MRKVVGAFVVMAVVIAIGSSSCGTQTGSERPDRTAEMVTSQLAKSPKGSLNPDAVLVIAPRSREMVKAPESPPLSPAVREYYTARSFAAVHARLKASTSRTPEENWLLAEILQNCATIVDDPSPRRSPETFGPAARDRFVASIAPNDPDRDRRIAAFDRVNVDRCEGLRDLKVTHKEIRALYEAGAAGGDAKSRARLVGQEIGEQTIGPDGKEAEGAVPKISDTQLETLRQAMASGDPVAMRAALALLTVNYDNMSLRDANDRPVDRSALLRAMGMYACQLGENCGPDSDYLAHFCAMEGECGANFASRLHDVLRALAGLVADGRDLRGRASPRAGRRLVVLPFLPRSASLAVGAASAGQALMRKVVGAFIVMALVIAAVLLARRQTGFVFYPAPEPSLSQAAFQ